MLKVSPKFAVSLVIAVGVLQCSCTQLSAAALQNSIMAHSIYFLMWLSLSLNCVFFPIAAIAESGASASSPPPPMPISSTSAANADVGGEAEDPPSPSSSSSTFSIVARTFHQHAPTLLLLYIGYVIANVAYSEALASASMLPSVVSTIFASCPLFVIFFSWLLQSVAPTGLEWGCVVFGVTGVALSLQPWKDVPALSAASSPSSGSINSTVFADASASTSTIATTAFVSASPAPATSESAGSLSVGLVAAMLSPIAAAAYKVVFSKAFADSRWFDAGRILGMLSLINMALGTLLIFAIVFPLHVETPIWEQIAAARSNNNNSVSTNSSSSASHGSEVPSTRDWLLFWLSAPLAILFNLCVNWAVTVMPPLYVSFGTLLATVLNLFVDFALGRGAPSLVQCAGMMLVMAACLAVARASRSASPPGGSGSDSGEQDVHTQQQQRGEALLTTEDLPLLEQA